MLSSLFTVLETGIWILSKTKDGIAYMIYGKQETPEEKLLKQVEKQSNIILDMEKKQEKQIEELKSEIKEIKKIRIT